MLKERTCPVCGKVFTPFRADQRYCSTQHRKRAENQRAGYVREGSGMQTQDAWNTPEKDEQNQGESKTIREDAPAFIVRHANWIACNEITQKLEYKGRAIGWLTYINKRGWFGRVKDDRGDYSYGPCRNISRAQKATEAWIKHEPFDKDEHELSFRGNCLQFL